jgi:hypothetical protein
MSATRQGGSARGTKGVREIIAGLYSADMESRFDAARKLGELARDNPETVLRVWTRIFYSFDDTMSCWGVAEALGEIARNLPGHRSKILALLRKFRADEASCQGFVWAVCRIGQVDRRLVDDFIPDLMHILDCGAACMIGQTIWAIGELDVSEAAGKVSAFIGDQRETWLYENDGVRKISLDTIARETLEKIGI